MIALKGSSDRYQINLERGEKLMQKLTEFVNEYKIQGGQITGIGAIEKVQLAAYDLQKKEYHYKTFDNEIYELISFIGNITKKNGMPFVHAHISMSDHEYKTFAGHLVECEIGVVGEFFVTPLGAMPIREMDERIGLPSIVSLEKY